jgi:hypothetical protein
MVCEEIRSRAKNNHPPAAIDYLWASLMARSFNDTNSNRVLA